MPDARSQPQAVSLPKRVLFLHIAKTAGTSIVHFFRQRLPAQSICSHGDFLHYPAGRVQFQAKLLEHQFISGHFGYRQIAPLLADSYSFTFLRDPVDRVLSFYNFCQNPDMQQRFPVARAARDLGLADFISSTLPEVSEILDNQQVWQLASMYWREDRQILARLPADELLAMAAEHLQQFNYIGLTESFQVDFGHILEELEIAESVPEKKQFASREPLGSGQLSPAIQETLRERLELDYRLLDIARVLRLERYGSP
jgi:hypothetical protein